MSEKKQLGRILLKQKAVSPEQLDKALDTPGGRLASKLMEGGAISGLAALKALSEQYGIPGLDLEQVCVKLSDLDLLPRDIAERHLILPVLSRGDRLFVAMANPREKKVIDELEFVTGKRVYPYVALETPLAATITEAYSRKARGDEYYVGPTCPPETLKKLGIDSSTAEASRGGLSRPPPAPGTMMEPGAMTEPGGLPPVQDVDDEGPGSLTAEQQAPLSLEPEAASQETPGVTAEGSSEDVAYEDFGDLNSELSVVTDLPEQAPVGAGTTAPTVLVVDDEAEIRRMLDKLSLIHI